MQPRRASGRAARAAPTLPARADGRGRSGRWGSGGGTAVAGKAGIAADLDGAGGHLTATVPLSTGSFSWAGWVRMDALPSGDFSIVANHGNGPVSYAGWLVAIDATGTPWFFTEAGSGATEIGTATHQPLAAALYADGECGLPSR